MQEQSTLEANKALIRRWFEEVWNKGRVEAIDEMFAADGIAHGLSDLSVTDLRPQNAVWCVQSQHVESPSDGMAEIAPARELALDDDLKAGRVE
jgi:hypothetical protein